jgi:hypothetical protein
MHSRLSKATEIPTDLFMNFLLELLPNKTMCPGNADGIVSTVYAGVVQNNYREQVSLGLIPLLV